MTAGHPVRAMKHYGRRSFCDEREQCWQHGLLWGRCIAFNGPERAYEAVSQAARMDPTLRPVVGGMHMLVELSCSTRTQSLVPDDPSKASLIGAIPL